MKIGELLIRPSPLLLQCVASETTTKAVSTALPATAPQSPGLDFSHMHSL